jgi:hypothetical protein
MTEIRVLVIRRLGKWKLFGIWVLEFAIIKGGCPCRRRELC